ncbi:MAG: hypothetical protein ISS82_03185 [Nanoarchaeota archaeon]|nr:hypothetical protein [Nanoarchaeota archaeon]
MVKVPEKNENKNYQDIYDTINQSGLKPGNPEVPTSGPNPLNELEQFDNPRGEELEEPPAPNAPEVPTPSSPMYEFGSQNIALQQEPSQVQEIVESVIEEKWDDLLLRVGDLNLWKEKVNTELTSIKQEIIRTQTHFMNLQKAVLGKVGEYNKNILNVNSEMQALEKVFQKILEPMTKNIRELSRVTEKLKKKK